MNKTIILLCVAVCSAIGSYIPLLLGESLLGGWSILGGFVGGIFGIWLGVTLSRRWE